MTDIPIDISEQCIFIRQPDGVYKEASFKTGVEYSMPMVITDYVDPTKRVNIITDGVLERLAVDAKITVGSTGHDTVSSLTRTLDILNEGAGNFLRHRLYVFSEACQTMVPEVVSYNVGTVAYLQIFRASSTNIHKFKFRAAALGGGTILVDDFNADITGWTDDGGGVTSSHDTVTKYEGAGAMKVAVSEGKGDSVQYDYGAGNGQDWSNGEAIRFWFRSTSTEKRIRVWVEDDSGQRLRSGKFTVGLADTWEHEVVLFEDMSEREGGVTDLSDIRLIWFEVADDGTFDFWVDKLEVVLGGGVASVATLKLYDFATTADPANLSAGTLLTLDNGNTSESVTVDHLFRGGVSIGLEKGIASGQLTIGNYYGVWIEIVNGVLAGSLTQKYQSGKLYLESGGVLTDESASLWFGVYSVPAECVIKRIKLTANDKLLCSEIYVNAYDVNSTVIDALVADFRLGEETMSDITLTERSKVLVPIDTLGVVLDRDIVSVCTKLWIAYEFTYDDFTRYG